MSSPSPAASAAIVCSSATIFSPREPPVPVAGLTTKG